MIDISANNRVFSFLVIEMLENKYDIIFQEMCQNLTEIGAYYQLIFVLISMIMYNYTNLLSSTNNR